MISPFDLEAAKKLPPNILFGTSTWTYPGWKGLIYQKKYKSEKEFNHKSLSEYCEFPWFRTVGIDNSFYRPLSVEQIEEYSSLVPSGFRWVSKVWERLTVPEYPRHARYGANAGKPNESFLDPKLFKEAIIDPYHKSNTLNRLGAFVFQFPTIGKKKLWEGGILGQLNDFFANIPNEFRYAVEIRNPELLSKEYFSLLNAHGVTHCFNHWDYMPGLKDQMKSAAVSGGLTAPFYVARILTPRGVSYSKAVEMFKPYNDIKIPNPEMRDDVVRLAKRAIERKVDAYIIVNNRAEGNAPLTIDAIGRKVVRGE